MAADKITPLGAPTTDVAAKTDLSAGDEILTQPIPAPVPMEVTPTGEDASRVIKGEETKTTSGALKEPGGPARDDEADEKEEHFVRSALGWLRDNVAKNPWIRGAVAVGSFFFPPLMFLSFIFLALDAILILDKLIAGEPLKLSDVLGFIGELIAASVNADALLPLSQAAIAGFEMFERWRDKRARSDAELAAAAAADTATIEKQADESMRKSAAMLERFEAAEHPTSDDATVVGSMLGTMSAARTRDGYLEAKSESDSERIQLKNVLRRLAERLEELRRSQPAWMERQIGGSEEEAEPTAEPAPA